MLSSVDINKHKAQKKAIPVAFRKHNQIAIFVSCISALFIKKNTEKALIQDNILWAILVLSTFLF